MSELDNIKPGDVFEFYDKNRFEPDSDQESYYGSDDEMYYEPYIAREQETIYLGKEEIDGELYGHFLTVNNFKNGSYTFYYKTPLTTFLKKIKLGFLRDNRGSKIPQPLLEEIRFSIPEQKKRLAEIEKQTKIELTPDTKNKILSFLQRGKNTKDVYKNETGGKRKTIKLRKSRKTRMSKKTRKSRKSRKTRKFRTTKK